MPPPPEVSTALESDSSVAMATSQRSIPRWFHVLIAILLLAGGFILWRGVNSAAPSNADAAHSLTLVSPAAGAAHEELTVFVWRTVPGTESYLLQVLDQGDRVVVSGETTDTTLLMAQAALPAAATSLRWRVTARMKDGAEVRSPDRQLSKQ